MARVQFMFLFLAVTVVAQTADPMPYETLKAAIQIIQSAKPASRQSNERFVIDKVRQQRLDFPVTEQVVSEMKRAGASDELIRAARESSLNIDDLLNSARRDLQAGRAQQALAAAQKAANWQVSAEVWRLIAACKVKLGDSTGAYDAYSRQIAAGGELTIPVELAPPGENFHEPCPARLTVGQHLVNLTASTPKCSVALDITPKQILEAGMNQFVGTDRAAFHLQIRTDQDHIRNFSLAPTDGGKAAAEWLVRTIKTVQ